MVPPLGSLALISDHVLVPVTFSQVVMGLKKRITKDAIRRAGYAGDPMSDVGGRGRRLYGGHARIRASRSVTRSFMVTAGDVKGREALSFRSGRPARPK
jgi:hypothetical protein